MLSIKTLMLTHFFMVWIEGHFIILVSIRKITVANSSVKNSLIVNILFTLFVNRSGLSIVKVVQINILEKSGVNALLNCVRYSRSNIQV